MSRRRKKVVLLAAAIVLAVGGAVLILGGWSLGVERLFLPRWAWRGNLERKWAHLAIPMIQQALEDVNAHCGSLPHNVRIDFLFSPEAPAGVSCNWLGPYLADSVKQSIEALKVDYSNSEASGCKIVVPGEPFLPCLPAQAERWQDRHSHEGSAWIFFRQSDVARIAAGRSDPTCSMRPSISVTTS